MNKNLVVAFSDDIKCKLEKVKAKIVNEIQIIDKIELPCHSLGIKEHILSLSTTFTT